MSTPCPTDTLDSNSMKNQIMNQIILKLYQNKEESEQHDEDSEVFLSFSKIDSQTADKILEEVDRQVERHFVRAGYNSHTQTLSFLLMPTFVHNSHQSWLFYSIQKASIQQVFTIQEAANMRISTGSRHRGFLAPYSASRKEPDQCITPAGASLPTIVFECGWSESRSHLHSDRDLWLQGGRGAVRLVIIVKWRKNTASRTVKGDLEVFDLDPQGVVRSLQREDIFPIPQNAALQEITLSKQEIFGQTLANLQNPTQVVRMRLDDLRAIAQEDMAKDNWTPA